MEAGSRCFPSRARLTTWTRPGSSAAAGGAARATPTDDAATPAAAASEDAHAIDPPPTRLRRTDSSMAAGTGAAHSSPYASPLLPTETLDRAVTAARAETPGTPVATPGPPPPPPTAAAAAAAAATPSAAAGPPVADVLSFSVVAADVVRSVQLLDVRALSPAAAASGRPTPSTAAPPAAPPAGPGAGEPPADAAPATAYLLRTHRVALELDGSPALAAGLVVDTAPPPEPAAGAAAGGLAEARGPRAALALSLLGHVVCQDADAASMASYYPHWSGEPAMAEAVLLDIARQFRQSAYLSAALAHGHPNAAVPPLPQHLAVADRLLQLLRTIPASHLAPLQPRLAPPVAAPASPGLDGAARRR